MVLVLRHSLKTALKLNNFLLTFVVPPYPRSRVESIERNSVTLTCRARGNPRPHIEWNKEGLSLALDPHYHVRPSGDLFIRHVRMVDRGIYRCRATNRAGAVAASTRLVVTGKYNVYDIAGQIKQEAVV